MSPRATLVVVGASGRMGTAVVRLAKEEGAFRLTGAVGRGVGRDVGDAAGVGTLGIAVQGRIEEVAGADVVIDFSRPGLVIPVAAWAASHAAALVSGTTGIDHAAQSALDAAAERVPVLWEPNMSIGAHVLSMLVEQAVSVLGPAIDVEVVELHHRGKMDAPSGTALRLAQVARGARGDEGPLVHGRFGNVGARRREAIGIHAVRGGDVVGEHTVHLLAEGERLELTHRASSRDLFARGALRAAGWLLGRAAGRYTLADVVKS